MTDRRRNVTIIGATIAVVAIIVLVVVLAGGGSDDPPDVTLSSPPATNTAPDATAAARMSIERNALRYQRALNPDSSDDPCRYMTPEAADDAVARSDPEIGARGCKAVVRAAEAEQSRPLYELLDDGITNIEFLPRVPVAGIAGTAAGAKATWRGDSSRSATFVERDGQWLIAK